MAIQNQPSRIPEPFAGSGTKNVIPATNATPSASQAASWASGFPPECSRPLSAGGCPVPRDDMNGIFNTITQSERFTQEGGIWAWDATVDYAANRLVLGSDGLLYWSVAQSGPNVGGAQDPTTDDGTYWGTPSMPTMPAGDVSQAVATTGFVGAAINIAIPVGTVIWSANPAVPSGYLPCNGAAVSRTDYANLFAAIGTLYGAGNGSTTFNLPDARDRVLQGALGTHSVGSYIAAGLPNITGKLSAAPRFVGGIRNESVFARSGAFSYADSEDWSSDTITEEAHPYSWHLIKLDASRSSSIYGNSSTVQPPALCLLPCIRYE